MTDRKIAQKLKVTPDTYHVTDLAVAWFVLEIA